MRWTEVLEKRMTDQVQWAKIKRPLRIIEKTLRSYRHDPSYLCDICRQCIVFETMEDLVRCVQQVISDKVSLLLLLSVCLLLHLYFHLLLHLHIFPILLPFPSSYCIRLLLCPHLNLHAGCCGGEDQEQVCCAQSWIEAYPPVSLLFLPLLPSL